MLPLQHRTVGKVGVEPTVSCSQGTRGTVPLHPVCISQQLVWESNPSLRLERAVSSSRLTNEPTVLAVSAHAERKWVGRRSNPRLLVFSQALNRLSYRPRFRVVVSPPPALAPCQQKRPDVFVTPGLCRFVAKSRPSVTSAVWARAYSPPANRFPAHLDARSSLAARNNPHFCVLGSNSVVRKTWC